MIERFKLNAIKTLSLVTTCYILYTAIFGKFTAMIQRGVFITLILMLGFLMSKHKENTPKAVHYIMRLLTDQFIEYYEAQLKVIENPAYPGHSFPLGETGMGISISDDNCVMISPAIFEEFNMAVVADDLAQESRQYRTDTPTKGGGGLKRLALQWMNRYGCSLIHELGKPRGNMLSQLCKETGADGVVTCMMKFCDPEEYDQPYYQADLRDAGYPYAVIDIDQQNYSLEQIRTRIQTFGEML